MTNGSDRDIVERLSFDYGIEFLLSSGTTVRIEGPATLVSPGGSRQGFNTESPRAIAEAVPRLLHQAVDVRVDGSLLVLRADNGYLIEVPPSDDYEAWNISLANGSRTVCGPLGEVTIWSPS